MTKTFQNIAVIVAAVAALSAGAASAQSLTRAEVKAQLAAAEADGTLNILDNQDSGSAYLEEQFHSTEPRAEVKAELATAEKNGTLNALTGEDSGSFALSHVEQTQAIHAVASGQ